MLKENDDDDSSLSSISSTATTTTITMTRQREIPNLSPEDRIFVSSMFTKFNNDSKKMMEAEIAKNIDTMSPSLLVALQLAGETREWTEKDGAATAASSASVIEFESQMVCVGQALRNVLTERLQSGKELLEQMLTSGEIRKLDALIGKSAREGLLDTSFFQVLNANMMDASSSTIMSTSNNKIDDDRYSTSDISNSSSTIPDKLQILNHIQTRCHEELEKAVPPGTGLLNKLLRTTIPSIRDNQLRHYLGPRATSITSPDGKVIDLHLPKSGSNNSGEGAGAAPLVSHVEFGTAISDAILRIRSIDTAGGTDKLVAQKLIEEVRQIAIEARRVLVSVNEGGEESTVVMEYSEMLGPVFRPTTTGAVTSTAAE
jgi:hypothetical protein